MCFLPLKEVGSHAEAGMLSVLEGTRNNHENKQGVGLRLKVGWGVGDPVL